MSKREGFVLREQKVQELWVWALCKLTGRRRTALLGVPAHGAQPCSVCSVQTNQALHRKQRDSGVSQHGVRAAFLLSEAVGW